MEAELSNSEWRTPFIAGPQFTIADATYVPYFALFGPAGAVHFWSVPSRTAPYRHFSRLAH